MTQQFKDYVASRPAATTGLATGDTVLALQGGVVVKAAPEYVASILDSGGSGKRFRVTVFYQGLADDGVTPILAFSGVEV